MGESPLAQRVNREIARPSMNRVAYENPATDNDFMVALCVFSVGFWLLQLFIHDGGIRSLLIGKVCLSLLASQGVASLAASSEANAKKVARLLALRSANEATVASEPLTFWFDPSGILLTGFHQLLQLQLVLDRQQQQHQ